MLGLIFGLLDDACVVTKILVSDLASYLNNNALLLESGTLESGPGRQFAACKIAKWASLDPEMSFLSS